MFYLFVLPSATLGGAERVALTLAVDRAAEGHRVRVICMRQGRDREGISENTGLELRFVDSSRELTALVPVALDIARICRRDRIGVTMGTHTHVNAFLGLLRKFGVLRTDVLVMRESTVFRDRWVGLKRELIRLLYRLGYGQADVVIGQTDYMMQAFDDIGLWTHRWNRIVAPNPIDLARATRESVEAVPEDQVPPGPYLVSAGRLIPEKGYDVLIRSFARLRRTWPDLHLLILGDGADRTDLEQLGRDLGVSEYIRLPGRVSNPFPLFAGSEVCVVASRIEGFPNVLLEMMAVHGRVVSTLCAGGIDSLNGVVTCAPDDPEQLANAIDGLLRTPSSPPNLIDGLEGRTPSHFWQRVGSALDPIRRSRMSEPTN